MRTPAQIRNLISQGVPTAISELKPDSRGRLLVFTKVANTDYMLAQTRDGNIYNLEKGDASSQRHQVLRSLGQDRNDYKLKTLITKVIAEGYDQCLVYQMPEHDQDLIGSEIERSSERLALAKELHKTNPAPPPKPKTFDPFEL